MGYNLLRLVLLVFLLEFAVYLFRLMKIWYHVILLMLLLEFLSIKGFLLCRLMLTTKIRGLFLFFFSVIIVCEARMGIGLVVRLTRAVGMRQSKFNNKIIFPPGY